MDEPLLRTTTTRSTTTTATAIVITRVSSILVLAAISVWANQQANKYVEVVVVANSALTSPAARLYELSFVSNGRAARIIYSATQLAEHTLYPDHRFPRKPVNHITLQLTSHNLTTAVSVEPRSNGVYVISLSPNVSDVAAAIRRGVAYAWLWDGEGTAPAEVVDALAGYLSGAPAEMVGPCEQRSPGFVARLNMGMRERWSEGAVDHALGSPAANVCAAFRAAGVKT